jgi:hypothetical protein
MSFFPTLRGSGGCNEMSRLHHRAHVIFFLLMLCPDISPQIRILQVCVLFSIHSAKCHKKWVIDPTKNIFLE